MASRQSGRGERGQVLVLFALLLPVFLAFGSIVMDVGQWYVHKKSLQTLVDAGALAAASKFVGCSFQFGDPAAANFAIRDAALEYAGDPTRDPATYNRQLQVPNDVHVLLNATRYWEPGDPTDSTALSTALDYKWDIDGDGGGGDPCSERSLDVKGTEQDAPLLWGLIPLRPDIKSRARILVNQVVEQAGMLPWAVPEVEPAAAAAIFVDEGSGNVIGAQQLEKRDFTNLPFMEWVTSGMDWNADGTPRSELVPNASRVDLGSENTGVVILLSKVNRFPPFGTLSVSGTLSQICGQSPGLVTCHAGSTSQSGLAFINGWSDKNGSPVLPEIREVSVVNVGPPNGCQDLSAPYFLETGDCELGVRATIHMAPTPGFNPQTAVVTLTAPGCKTVCSMAYIGAGGSGETVWQTTQNAKFDDDFSGRATFSITVKTVFPTSPTPVTNTRIFPGVAHPFVTEPADLPNNMDPTSSGAGPVDYLKLSSIDPLVHPYSRNTGDPVLASVVVTIGFVPPFQVESPLAPPVLLRVASPAGSQNQAFDCDKLFNFETEIEKGCATTYRENYGDWDDDGDKEWSDLLCADYPNGIGLPTDPSSPPPVPDDCVRIETGKKLGQFRTGIARRVMTPSCAPNNWPDTLAEFPDFFRNIDPDNDPRYVTLVITDYATFQGEGSSGAVPVKYFAGFYITGWDKIGNAAPCADNEPHPWYGSSYRKSLDNGDVWGHFINITLVSSAGGGSDDLCNFDEIGTCIIGLVE